MCSLLMDASGGARLAEENLGGQNVEWLEAALDELEDPLQVR